MSPPSDGNQNVYNGSESAPEGGPVPSWIFEALIRSNPLLAVQLYDEACRVLLWNEASVGTTGIPEAEALGREMGELFRDPSVPEQFLTQCRALTQDRSYSPEAPYSIRHQKTGELRHTVSSVFRADTPEGSLFACLDIDVTARTRAEAALKESEAWYRRTLEQISLLVIAISEEGIIQFVNRPFMEASGYTLEELQGRNAFDVMLPRELRDEAWRMHQEGLARNEPPPPIEIPIVDKEGRSRRIRWITSHLRNAEGRRVGSLGIGEDISREHHAELRVRESDRRFRETLETIQAIAVALDSRGRITFLNDFAARLLGASAESLLGRDWFEHHVRAEDRVKLSALYGEIMRGLDPPRQYENPIVTLTGEVRQVAWVNTLLRDPEGRPCGTVSVGEDVTDRRRSEEVLRETESRYRGFLQNFRGIAYQVSGPPWIPEFFHGQVKEITGHEEQDFTSGRVRWRDLLHPEDEPRVASEFQRLAEGTNTLLDLRYRIVARSGEVRWIHEVGFAVSAGPSLAQIQGALYDVTLQVMADMDSNRSRLRLERQKGILEQIARGRSIASVFDSIARMLESEDVHRSAVITYLDETGRRFLHGASPSMPSGFDAAVHNREIEAETATCGAALTQRRAVYTHDVEQDPLWANHLPFARRFGIRAVWAFPITAISGTVLGIVSLYFQQPRRPQLEDIGALELAASLAAIALERQLASEALRESESRFASFMEHLPVIAQLKDEKGSILFSNRMHKRMLGRDPIGLTAHDYLPAEDAERLLWHDERARRESVLFVEESARLPSGELRHFETTKFAIPRAGRGIYVGVLSIDITDRLKAREALRENEERLRSLGDNLPNGAVFRAVVSPDGTWNVLYASAGLRRLLGVNPESPPGVGRDFFRHLAPPDRTRVLGAIMAAAAEHRAVEAEFPVQLPSGQHHVLMRGAPSAQPDGSTIWDGILLDQTERRREEERRREFELHLQHTQKLESLGILAGGIAHDFNNLLTVILGNADFLLKGVALHEAAREGVQEILTVAQRAAGLCRQMLAYSGRGTFILEPLDVRALVEEMAALLHASISKKVTLRFNFQPSAPFVIADATQLQQVVLNLLTNAAEAIGDAPGSIDVTIRDGSFTSQELHSPWTIDILPAGRYVVLEVEDSGCGIAPEALRRIFDPFYSTKFTGRGLGLSNVLGIVRGHKGSIQVESRVGQGTLFRIFLPAVMPQAPTLPQDETAAPVRPPAVDGNGTVLVVDDEAQVRRLISRAVERMGFQVLTATDGNDALTVDRAHRSQIVLAVIDMTMPGKDGKETLAELRRLGATYPVLISSGYSEQEVATMFVGAHRVGFLQKPFRLTVLEARVKELLGA